MRIDELGSIARKKSFAKGGRVFRISAVLLYVVVSVVSGYRSHVVLFSLEDVSVAYAAFDLTGDTVAVSFRVLG